MASSGLLEASYAYTGAITAPERLTKSPKGL